MFEDVRVSLGIQNRSHEAPRGYRISSAAADPNRVLGHVWDKDKEKVMGKDKDKDNDKDKNKEEDQD